MFRRTALLAGLVAVGLTASAAPAEAALKIGVVDIIAVMDGVPAWKKTVEKLKKDWEKKQKQLKADQDGLRSKKDALDAKRVVSDPQTIAREEAQLMQEASKLAQDYVIQQRIITAQEFNLKDQLLKRVEPLVFKIANEGDYAFVFEKGSEQAPNVLYFAKKVDLTKLVIRDYKRTYKNKAFEVKTPTKEEIAKALSAAGGPGAAGP